MALAREPWTFEGQETADHALLGFAALALAYNNALQHLESELAQRPIEPPYRIGVTVPIVQSEAARLERLATEWAQVLSRRPAGEFRLRLRVYAFPTSEAGVVAVVLEGEYNRA